MKITSQCVIMPCHLIQETRKKECRRDEARGKRKSQGNVENEKDRDRWVDERSLSVVGLLKGKTERERGRQKFMATSQA